MGTHKVITEHATIGMLITTDGSIGEISRESYVEAEERVVRELKALGKPFAVILNSAHPSSDTAVALAYELEEKYGVPVALVSCIDLDAEDIRHILELVLHEFPVAEVRVRLPEWTTALEPTHRIHASLISSLRRAVDGVKKIGDIRSAFEGLSDNEYLREATVDEVDLGRGCARVTLHMMDGLYYQVISELTGFDIDGEESLIQLLCHLSEMKSAYDKVAEALADCNEKGYGIVMPDVADMSLDEPEIVRQSGGYGVRLRASASSVHMIRANIEAEINPIVGSASLRRILTASGSLICLAKASTSWSTRGSTPSWSICPRPLAPSCPRLWSVSSTKVAAASSASCFEGHPQRLTTRRVRSATAKHPFGVLFALERAKIRRSLFTSVLFCVIINKKFHNEGRKKL